MEKRKSLNIKGSLLSIEKPLIMGILNITPDSFYAHSRFQTEEESLLAVEKMLTEGASIIDVGGVSTRPFSEEISLNEEISRLQPIVVAIRRQFPQAIISVDTWRSEVVRCLAAEGIDMVNDISGGQFDPNMFQEVAAQGLAYVMMHTNTHPKHMQENPHYENLMNQLFFFFSKQLKLARQAGLNDIIIDPGFGFGKTLAHNVELMQHLDEFHFFGIPLMVGISRKSMIYKTLHTTPEEALNGTTVLHTLALLKGANILRVHDVSFAKEVIDLIDMLKC
ncbi:MAG: dihydropteroate synthase [Bacteroidota bacterium]